jgi:hypothetical protein
LRVSFKFFTAHDALAYPAIGVTPLFLTPAPTPGATRGVLSAVPRSLWRPLPETGI